VTLCYRRINTLSKYVNESANVYTLGNVLPTATWGKYHPSNDHSKELCNPTMNEVVVIWIVGHIVSTWFQCDGFPPEKQASITIMPLSDELRNEMARLLAGLSIPRESMYSLSFVNCSITSVKASINTSLAIIRAIKWQTAKGDVNPVSLIRHTYEDMCSPNYRPDRSYSLPSTTPMTS
jgi:hypothetical protein